MMIMTMMLSQGCGSIGLGYSGKPLSTYIYYCLYDLLFDAFTVSLAELFN